MTRSFDRVLVLHSYPPVPCLYTFEKGLRELGYDVVSVGPKSRYINRDAFKSLEPDCEYTVVDPNSHLNDVFDKIGGLPDWVFYLRPAELFFPSGLQDCPVPTVGWLEDDFKYCALDLRWACYFDLAPTAYGEISDAFRAYGIDNRVCFNYFTASWLQPDQDVDFDKRPIDVSLVGHIIPALTRRRARHVEQLRRLRQSGIKVFADEGVFLNGMMTIYANSKIVLQSSGQGNPNLTYRVGEAMTAGAMVIAERPTATEGLYRPLVEDTHIVYFDSFEEARDRIRYYLEHDDERRTVVESSFRYVREEAPWVEQIRWFVDTHVKAIPDDFLDLRRERMRRCGLDPSHEPLDRAVARGARGDVEGALKALESMTTADADARLHVRFPLLCPSAGNWEPYQRYFEAIDELCPNETVRAYNDAVALYARRATVGADGVLDSVRAGIELLQGAATRLTIDDVEGVHAMIDPRAFLEISQAYVDCPDPQDRLPRILDVLLFQLHKICGLTLYEARDYEQARTAFERALLHLPDDGYTLANQARVLLALGQPRDAARLYTQAVELEPFFLSAREELCEVLVQLRRGREATRVAHDTLLSYIEPGPVRLRFYLLLARAHAAAGRKELAVRALRDGVTELTSGEVDTGAYTKTRAENSTTDDEMASFLDRFRTHLTQLTG